MALTKTAMQVLREWWLEVARLGMTPSEAADSLSLALHAAGYKIVRRGEDK